MSGEYYIELEDLNKSRLPSEKNKAPQKKPKKPLLTSKDKNKIKWWSIIFFVLIIYIFYEPVLNKILELLQLNPTIHSIYLNIYSEIANNSLKGLFYVAILGSLFFLTLPSEALFIYFLNSTEFPFFIIILFMVLGNIAGLTFNYFFGLILGERTIKILFKKNFEKYKNKIDEYGGMVLFLGNIFPGPVEALTLFYGSFKFPLLRFIYLCMMGRLVKYLILFLIYMLYWDQVINFYDIILTDLEAIKTIYTLK